MTHQFGLFSFDTIKLNLLHIDFPLIYTRSQFAKFQVHDLLLFFLPDFVSFVFEALNNDSLLEFRSFCKCIQISIFQNGVDSVVTVGNLGEVFGSTLHTFVSSGKHSHDCSSHKSSSTLSHSHEHLATSNL